MEYHGFKVGARVRKKDGRTGTVVSKQEWEGQRGQFIDTGTYLPVKLDRAWAGIVYYRTRPRQYSPLPLHEPKPTEWKSFDNCVGIRCSGDNCPRSTPEGGCKGWRDTWEFRWPSGKVGEGKPEFREAGEQAEIIVAKSIYIETGTGPIVINDAEHGTCPHCGATPGEDHAQDCPCAPPAPEPVLSDEARRRIARRAALDDLCAGPWEHPSEYAPPKGKRGRYVS